MYENTVVSLYYYYGKHEPSKSSHKWKESISSKCISSIERSANAIGRSFHFNSIFIHHPYYLLFLHIFFSPYILCSKKATLAESKEWIKEKLKEKSKKKKQIQISPQRQLATSLRVAKNQTKTKQQRKTQSRIWKIEKKRMRSVRGIRLKEFTYTIRACVRARVRAYYETQKTWAIAFHKYILLVAST